MLIPRLDAGAEGARLREGLVRLRSAINKAGSCKARPPNMKLNVNDNISISKIESKSTLNL
jgi:hypothetical protein